MSNIAFRSTGNQQLSNLTFDGNALLQMVFDNSNINRAFVNTTGENGIAMNGNKYSHIYYKHKEYDITISADCLDSNGLNFLETWWSSLYKYISVQVAGAWTDYIEVVTERGRIPATFLENLEILPEVTFTVSTARKL